jgi:hypothetical protein
MWWARLLNNITGFLGGALAITGDYESIATANGTGSSNVITFSTIPSTYKHLQLRFITRGGAAGGYPADISSFVLNSDTTASNYYCHSLFGTGSGTPSTTAGNNNYSGFLQMAGAEALANTYVVGVIDFLDYANTNKYKTIRNLNGADFNGSGRVIFSSMLWKNTNAISSISITADPTYTGNFTTASSFALYGIKG